MLIHSFEEVKLLASTRWLPSKVDRAGLARDLRLKNVTLAKAGFTYDTAGRLDTVSEGSGMAAYQYRYHTGSGRIAGVNQRSGANAPWSTLMTRRLDSRLRVDRLYYGGSATSATGAVLGWDYQYDPDRPEKPFGNTVTDWYAPGSQTKGQTECIVLTQLLSIDLPIGVDQTQKSPSKLPC